MSSGTVERRVAVSIWRKRRRILKKTLISTDRNAYLSNIRIKENESKEYDDGEMFVALYCLKMVVKVEYYKYEMDGGENIKILSNDTENWDTGI